MKTVMLAVFAGVMTGLLLDLIRNRPDGKISRDDANLTRSRNAMARVAMDYAASPELVDQVLGMGASKDPLAAAEAASEAFVRNNNLAAL